MRDKTYNVKTADTSAADGTEISEGVASGAAKNTKEYNESLDARLEAARNGDEQAQAGLIEENTGLVWSVARRFLGRGYEAEDLFQIGCIGLIKAVRKFDMSFGVRFSTYAVPMIMGEIKRFIRDDGMIKVSRSIKELAIRALGVKEAMIRESGAEPTVKEIAKRLGVSAEELAAAMEAGARPESIDAAPTGDTQGGKALVDRLECKTDYENEIVNRILVRRLISEFDERERRVIILRYYKQKTQSAIAEMLGISQVQVSRIEKKALGIMRERLIGGG